MATPLSSLRAAPVSEAVPVEPRAEIMARFDVLLERHVPESHFFPRGAIRGFLEAKNEVGDPKYSADDLRRVYDDFLELYEKTFSEAQQCPVYVVTAGAPCSGKSTLLETVFLKSSPIKFAFIDPDRSCLLYMPRTYCRDREEGTRDPQGAYEHWREASNFLANVFMADALQRGVAIAHGSTMTSPHVRKAFEAIAGGYGYEVNILHVTCPDDVRLASEHARRKSDVVQCTDEDLIDKGQWIYDRLPDYVVAPPKKVMIFYYRSKLDEVAQEYARLTPAGGLKITGDAAFAEVRRLHDAAKGGGYWDRYVK